MSLPRYSAETSYVPGASKVMLTDLDFARSTAACLSPTLTTTIPSFNCVFTVIVVAWPSVTLVAVISIDASFLTTSNTSFTMDASNSSDSPTDATTVWVPAVGVNVTLPSFTVCFSPST